MRDHIRSSSSHSGTHLVSLCGSCYAVQEPPQTVREAACKEARGRSWRGSPVGTSSLFWGADDTRSGFCHTWRQSPNVSLSLVIGQSPARPGECVPAAHESSHGAGVDRSSRRCPMEGSWRLLDRIYALQFWISTSPCKDPHS